MNTFIEGVKAFLAEEEGLTIVEYSVAGALIAAATVAAFSALGQQVCTVIDFLTSAIGGAGAGACTPP